MDDVATTDEGARRRRIRNTALGLALFAVVVYFGFIIAFVSHRS
jgi:hypothetical protein